MYGQLNVAHTVIVRHKDKTSRESQLSQAESLRFRRAMYRIWLLSSVYGMGSITDYERDEENWPYSHLETYQDKQEGFLKQFNSAELLEIKRVAFFLRELASWAVIAEGSSTMSSLDTCLFLVLVAYLALIHSLLLRRLQWDVSLCWATHCPAVFRRGYYGTLFMARYW